MIRVALQKSLMGTEGNIDLQFQIQMQEQTILAIMGPSGVGKTSILKMLAGLLHPDDGHIMVGDRQWFSKEQRIFLSPQQRSVGFVFQDYSLFPNMSVRQNLEYALQNQHERSIVDEVLQLMNMEKLQQQKPGSLSGGQQQRVALARAIVRRPRLLLLDEPFAALDRRMREKLQDDLLHLHQRYGSTTVLVSHDAGEVARMADEVIYMEQGRAIRQGSPAKVLPVMQKGEISGQVVEIDQASQTFVLYARPAGGLWRFDLPGGSGLRKGDQLRVTYQQGRLIRKDIL